MNQAASINFKDTGSVIKRKLNGKFSVGLLVIGLVPAVFLYCRYLDRLTHVRVPAKTSRMVSAAAPVAANPKVAASLPKAGDQPASAKSDREVSAPAANVSFADSLMSVLTPSAKAVTMQPEMQPARPTATRAAVQPAIRAASGLDQLPLNAEQKRLQVARDGFAKVMELASQHPDIYGFLPDEKLWAARLGNPIPVYLIPQPSRVNYAGQPLTALLKPAEEWIFPIILDNRIRFMVQVRCVGREYVLGPGSRALAVVYDKILTRWPASEGFHPQLVINPDTPYYYFTIPELPVPNITDTSRIFDFNLSLSPATVILASWR